MIKAEFRISCGKLKGFSVSGHSGYDESGADIVCASVSSAVMLVCNAVTEIYHIPAEVSVGDNVITLRTDYHDDRLLRALKMHLEALAEDYPENITVNYSEV